ncbi:hypothetical protein DM01DRAFT_1325379 [Hesseltinella vesiculosa]|uniref:Uncharacterized protein n=1 Tax=Hesseltinella vesiculosa TaxID=101127 RepID=A0A1X2GCJ6_9FUNG|nr:hypothetical protein DM01DRAFT_1325379 [Hesseltinella vesiculosa]
MFYWLDCLVSTASTIWFATKWYVFTDHSLPDLDPIQQNEHDNVFQMESMVSIFFLAVLRLIHIYFALIITSYYRNMGHRYAKISMVHEFE